MTHSITCTADTLSLRFAPPFDLSSYNTFIASKAIPEARIEFDRSATAYTLTAPARYASALGIATPAGAALPYVPSPHLFDYQGWCVSRAIEARRFAIWADTGLDKTNMFLDWARHVIALTAGRVLIFSPAQIIEQTIAECAHYFDGVLAPPVRLNTREEIAAWCKQPGPGLAITNYEKMIDGVMDELRWLAGVVLDEASILKSGGGVIKWNLIKSCRGIVYKLALTATPAPNDAMEYASQAGFLEKLRNENEILWTFFTRDDVGEWCIKPHARAAFFSFMATWSIYMRDPKKFGFRDNLKDLPDPEVRVIEVPQTDAQAFAAMEIKAEGGDAFTELRMGVVERIKLSEIAKGFMYHGSGPSRTIERIASHKPRIVAKETRAMVRQGRQVIIWTLFDAETEIVLEQLAAGGGIDCISSLTGSVPAKKRQPIIDAFRAGDIRVLVTRADLVGKGLNFQCATGMIFSGFDDSFEDYYQAIRRIYRYGQTQVVRIVVPFIRELEGTVWENLMQKKVRDEKEVAECEANYILALLSELESRKA